MITFYPLGFRGKGEHALRGFGEQGTSRYSVGNKDSWTVLFVIMEHCKMPNKKEINLTIGVLLDVGMLNFIIMGKLTFPAFFY